MEPAAMNPAQRIVTVLRSRGREATPHQIDMWIEEMQGLAEKRFGVCPAAHWYADAIESGAKIPTACLHIKFGDAL
jgi:hypothetical protein